MIFDSSSYDGDYGGKMSFDIMRVFSNAVHDLRQMPVVSSISRFHIQIMQLFLFVFIWVHWDACLQYGACAAQPPIRLANVTKP